MKIVIVGAGAIGGYLGARLANAGVDVTLVARGPHLAAMRARGLRVLSAEGDFESRPKVVGDPADAGKADAVILGVKAHSLAGIVPKLSTVYGPDTFVVSTQNGIPWWYFQRGGGQFEGLRLESVDPGGVVAAGIPVERVVGSLAYFSAEISEPGVIRHIEGNRLSLGEPDGTRSDRCRLLAETMIGAGIRCPVTTRLRSEIWVKLLGNIAFNPLSALTGATLVRIVRHPDAARLVREVMAETEAVAAKLGIELPISIDQRMAGAEKVGEHKTSMLQDLEAGRPMEIDAIAGAVVELGDRLGVAMPATRAMYAAVKLLDSERRSPLK